LWTVLYWISLLRMWPNSKQTPFAFEQTKAGCDAMRRDAVRYAVPGSLRRAAVKTLGCKPRLNIGKVIKIRRFVEL